MERKQRSHLAAILVVSLAFAAAVSSADAQIPCEPQPVMAPDWGTFDMFGIALGLQGDTAVIGAPNHFHPSPPAPSPTWGSVFVYQRIDGLWTFQQEMVNPHSAIGTDDNFARFTIAIDRDIFMVGASGHTHAGIGGGLCMPFVIAVRGGRTSRSCLLRMPH